MAKVTSQKGDIPLTPAQMGIASLGKNVNVVYGDTAIELTRPTIGGNPANMLYLHVESGSFRIKAGNFTGDTNSEGTLTSDAAVAAVTDGSAGMLLSENDLRVYTAPSSVTVVGASGTDILTYYWL